MRKLLSWALLLAVGLLANAAPVVAQPAFYNFESGQVRPLALSPSRTLLFAANTPDNRVEIFRVAPAGLSPLSEIFVGLEPVAIAVRGEAEIYVVNHLSDSVSVVDVSSPERPFVRQTLLVGDEPRDIVVAGPDHDKIFVTTAHRGQNRPGDPQLQTPGVGRADVWVFDAAELDATPHIITLFTDTPRGLAASPDGRRVYVAGFHSGNQTTVLPTMAVDDGPRYTALINDGFEAPGMPEPSRNHAGVPARPAGVILKYGDGRWLDDLERDWTPRVRLSLPDRDLFTLDATADPPVEVGAATGVGTVLFNVAVNPADGRVYVSNMDSQNIVRFEPVLKGHLTENRVTIVDGTSVNPVHLNPHIDYSTPSGPPEEREQSLAFPLDMAFTRDGATLYVAAYGSGKVGVLNAEGVVEARIEVGGGPSGLALDEEANRLYVLNRFDQTVSVVDTARRAEVGTVPLRYNPEPAAVRDGRPVLYNGQLSGHGDAACASCHVFADFDSLAWDLGVPEGEVVPAGIERVVSQQQLGRGDTRVPLTPIHPIKGPMTTQSLRGMKGAGAMHWRGDRNGGLDDPLNEEKAFMQFLPAFVDLNGMGEELPLTEMEKFRDFILTVQYPPNPIAALDGSLTASQAAGKEIFESSGERQDLGGDGDNCAQCHALPTGSNGQGSTELFPQEMKVPHMRNLYQKVGMFGYSVPLIEATTLLPPRRQRQAQAADAALAVPQSDIERRTQATPTPHLGDQVRGFGYLHDGAVPTLNDFFLTVVVPPTSSPFTFPDNPGRSAKQKVRELVDFSLTFNTGLAPAVGQQVTLTAGDLVADPPVRLDRYHLLRERADAGDLDLVVHGLVGGSPRGILYLATPVAVSSSVFQTDRADELFTWGDLVEALESDSVLTVTAVPPGSGARIAIDRDEDGALDRDEIDEGSDPADPSSGPA